MGTEFPLSLLQFSDGLFPAGAYAHSLGLETYVQTGTISDAAGVEAFVRAFLEGSAAPMDAKAAALARRAALEGDLASCLSLDSILEAAKVARELREASRQMGRQILRIAVNLSPQALLQDLYSLASSGATQGHHAVAWGAVAGTLNWSERDTCGAYLYSAAAALVGAALRLLPLGQLAGQGILYRLLPAIAQLAGQSSSSEVPELWSFAPGLEIAAMRHARLEARLFRS
jgi:urease accessory protein